MSGLKISDDLTLPIDVAGEAIGILATRGAGKSYASAVLVEELYRAKVQVAVLDPTGVYWGLRAGADGKAEGLPIIVLGGPHGDVPLESTAGGLIADLLVDTGQSLILDLSDFPTKGAQTRFVTDFAERLYRRKARARTTLHLVVDEADEFAPQRPMRDEARMVGAMEVIVRRGRSRGLGSTLITQRSAALNKNVLDVIDTLVAMRIGSPRDRNAVKDWITVKDVRDELGVLESLPGLPTGTAWVWSPVRGLLQKVAMRRIRTFDSYATPKPGEQRVEPAVLASIDLDKLGQQIQATAERAKADDPKELRRQITALKKDLDAARRDAEANAAKPGQPERVEVPVEVRVEVPVFSEDDRLMLKSLHEQTSALLHGDTAITRTLISLNAALEVLDEFEGFPTGPQTGRAQPVPGPRPGPSLTSPGDRGRAAPRPASAPRRGGPTANAPSGAIGTGATGRVADPPRSSPDDDDEAPLKLGERKMLAVVVAFRDQPIRPPQLATLCGMSYSKGGGTFGSYFRRLKRLGLVVDDGALLPTQEGMDYPNDQHVEVPQTTEDLVAIWNAQLKLGEREMLRVLVEEYPNPIPPPELADRLDMSYSKGGGTFGTYLRRLKRNGLAEGTSRGVVAGEALFVFGSAP